MGRCKLFTIIWGCGLCLGAVRTLSWSGVATCGGRGEPYYCALALLRPDTRGAPSPLLANVTVLARCTFNK